MRARMASSEAGSGPVGPGLDDDVAEGGGLDRSGDDGELGRDRR